MSNEEQLLTAAKLVKEGQRLIDQQARDLSFVNKWLQVFIDLAVEIKPRGCECELCKKTDRLMAEYGKERKELYGS